MLGWACATPSHAGQSDFGVGLSLARSSNITRVETNPQSDWTQAVMAGLSYRESTIDVNARVLAQVERRRYSRHTFSDDTAEFLDGAAVWLVLPRRLTWNIEDTFRQTLLNVAAPDTPTNRAKTNSLSTGPDFTFSLGSTTSAMVGGRYGRFDIENSINDNRRYTAYVRGLHALSAQTKLSLNYEAARVHFEPGALFPQTLMADLFGRYENRSSTNNTTIDVGTSRVTRYGDPTLEGNRLARVTMWEVLSSQSTFGLSLADQISDTYTDLIKGVTSSTAPADTSVIAAAPQGADVANSSLYHSKRGGLVYVNNGGYFGYTLQASRRRVDFVNPGQADYQEAGGAFQWNLDSGATRFILSAAYMKRTFESLEREDKERTYGASANYRLSPNVTIIVEGGRIDRQSTVSFSNFRDDRVMLLLGYRSGPLYEVKSRR
jgi:hypothetical protein